MEHTISTTGGSITVFQPVFFIAIFRAFINIEQSIKEKKESVKSKREKNAVVSVNTQADRPIA